MTRLSASAAWLRFPSGRRREALLCLAALVVVAVFWVVGLIGGTSYLHEASSPMAMLSGLYVMLAAVALSIIITTAALSRLAHHFSRGRPA